VVAALHRGFNYLYKISVYQIKFDWSQACCPIGARPKSSECTSRKNSFHGNLGWFHAHQRREGLLLLYF
jgi:hypothetical protein